MTEHPHKEYRPKFSKLKGTGKYPILYKNPLTGLVSEESHYINEQGNKINSTATKYLVNGEWVSRRNAPHNRETNRKYLNTKRGYLINLHKIAKRGLKSREKRGRQILGENELLDINRQSRPMIAKKFMKHFDEQVERYGYKCPLTLIPFTMTVFNKKFEINDQSRTFSNVSPDRIFNHIGYSKQNTLFTSQLWNLSKGERLISEIELIFKLEIMERYKAIVEERFPDQKYTL